MVTEKAPDLSPSEERFQQWLAKQLANMRPWTDEERARVSLLLTPRPSRITGQPDNRATRDEGDDA